MEITKGAMPGGGATQRLPCLIGPSRAARMILTGQVVEADEVMWDPRPSPLDGLRLAYLLDPEGNALELLGR